MTTDEIREAVLTSLSSIAPEADLGRIRPTVSFRDQLDIDSMDFLNFVIALHQKLDLEIPERDYPKLVTLNGCLKYVGQALEAKKPGGGALA